MDTLKSYRDNEIKWYIFTYLLIAVGVYGTNFFQSPISTDACKFGDLVITTTFSGAICTLAFVMDSLFSSKLKETLVFFGKMKVPGASVFSRIKNGKLKDNRFTNAEASQKYRVVIENIPENNAENFENAQWYKLYNKCKEQGAVVSTHRDFLLCRDLYITTISIFLLSIIGMISQIIKFSWILLIYLGAMLILTNLATHNKAHRFVNTVVAIDIATGDKD